jgi:hypothetical protein
MNKVFTTLLGASLLGAALAFVGCSQPDAPKPEPPPPAAATPAPAETPKATATENLTKAKENLTKAVNELKDKNYRGAQDLLTSANNNLTLAAESAPEPIKAGIDKAISSLAGIKDIKAPGTEKTLGALVTSVTSLTEMAGKTGALLDGAKGAASSAAEMTKQAAAKAMPKQ